jgi:lipopolysaccharide/colanic/teichoic acid biosynthesis glycosyltransferase
MRITKLFLGALLLAGCGVSQLNRNIEQNTVQMEKTSRAVQENTHEIQQSTKAMHGFQRTFPFLFLLIVVFLFAPAYVVFNLYRKLLSGKKPFTKKGATKPASFLKELFLP